MPRVPLRSNSLSFELLHALSIEEIHGDAVVSKGKDERDKSENCKSVLLLQFEMGMERDN